MQLHLSDTSVGCGTSNNGHSRGERIWGDNTLPCGQEWRDRSHAVVTLISRRRNVVESGTDGSNNTLVTICSNHRPQTVPLRINRRFNASVNRGSSKSRQSNSR